MDLSALQSLMAPQQAQSRAPMVGSRTPALNAAPPQAMGGGQEQLMQLLLQMLMQQMGMGMGGQGQAMPMQPAMPVQAQALPQDAYPM